MSSMSSQLFEWQECLNRQWQVWSFSWASFEKFCKLTFNWHLNCLLWCCSFLLNELPFPFRFSGGKFIEPLIEVDHVKFWAKISRYDVVHELHSLHVIQDWKRLCSHFFELRVLLLDDVPQHSLRSDEMSWFFLILDDSWYANAFNWTECWLFSHLIWNTINTDCRFESLTGWVELLENYFWWHNTLIEMYSL